MGAFCIFGISRASCRKKAERTVPPFEVVPATPTAKMYRRDLTIAEWGEKVAAEADRLFEETTRRTRISPELDAPQFCRDWLSTDPKQVKDAVVMVRGPKVDKKGNVVKRGGAVVETWLEYSAECARLGLAEAP